jgi:hypothetical protein
MTLEEAYEKRRRECLSLKSENKRLQKDTGSAENSEILPLVG